VVLGGPHAMVLPDEPIEHADAVVVGEAEGTWPRVVADAARGRLAGTYRSSGTADLAGMPAPRCHLIRVRPHGRPVMIATRGCPHRCDYCTIPLLYGPARVRYRPVGEVAAEVAGAPTRAVVLWDDNRGADPRYAKALFRALAPAGKWRTSQCTMAAVRDDEFLALAARSGCKALFVDLDSVSQLSLDGAHKGDTTGSPMPRIWSRDDGKRHWVFHGRLPHRRLAHPAPERRIPSCAPVAAVPGREPGARLRASAARPVRSARYRPDRSPRYQRGRPATP